MIDNIREPVSKIEDLLEVKDYRVLRSYISAFEPADIAEIFDKIDEDDIPLLFRILPKDLASDCFVEMDSDHQMLLISSFSDRELSDMMEDLFVDDTVDLIDEMPANVVKRILSQTPHEKRMVINQILAYPKGSTGAVMTTEFVELKADMT